MTPSILKATSGRAFGVFLNVVNSWEPQMFGFPPFLLLRSSSPQACSLKTQGCNQLQVGPQGLTCVGGDGLSNVDQGPVDWLLGLVTVLPEEHVAYLLPQLWLEQTVLDLLLNDIVCKHQTREVHGLSHCKPSQKAQHNTF